MPLILKTCTGFVKEMLRLLASLEEPEPPPVRPKRKFRPQTGLYAQQNEVAALLSGRRNYALFQCLPLFPHLLLIIRTVEKAEAPGLSPVPENFSSQVVNVDGHDKTDRPFSLLTFPARPVVPQRPLPAP